jgi:hypothetical protein
MTATSLAKEPIKPSPARPRLGNYPCRTRDLARHDGLVPKLAQSFVPPAGSRAALTSGFCLRSTCVAISNG